MNTILRLGKRPPTHDPRDLLFSRYRTKIALPVHPKQFGHEGLIGPDWCMLGNDQAGDCVFAGGAHETMLWTILGKRPAQFSTENVLADYSAVTGFDPARPDTDQGTLTRDALKYRRKVGLLDAAGKRHKIGAFIALEPGNTEHLLDALYLFGAVGIGIQFPSTAMDQFDRGRPWSVVRGAGIVGGHYIPLVAKRANWRCVTWGKIQEMTLTFYRKYCDEAWAILSPEMLVNGKTDEGFDLAQLQADLKVLES